MKAINVPPTTPPHTRADPQVRIAAKTLGLLALPNFCPRCFWLRVRSGNRLPFQMPFPGVFAQIDSYGKWVVADRYASSGKLPAWLDTLPGLVKPIPVPHHTRFRCTDAATGAELRGVPDEIFLRADGSHVIVDDKTSSFTPAQDQLAPLYRVQLNGYAFIAERCGLGPVSAIALCYYQPQGGAAARAASATPADVRADGFTMPFLTRVVELPLEPDALIPPLLRRAGELLSGPCPPESEDCESCARAAALPGLIDRAATASSP